jgi:hypothetical protein
LVAHVYRQELLGTIGGRDDSCEPALEKMICRARLTTVVLREYY